MHYIREFLYNLIEDELVPVAEAFEQFSLKNLNPVSPSADNPV